MAIQIPFGERDGRMWAPEEVANGAACGCVCPGCGGDLIAYQYGQKRPHFGHYHEVQCKGAVETALHRMAKQILARVTRFSVPDWPVTRSAKVGQHHAVHTVSIQGGVMRPTSSFIEPVCDGLKPDVILEDSTRAIWLEVRVSHPVDETKKSEIQRRGLRCIEIDLRNYRLVDEAELQRSLQDEVEHKHWVAHPETVHAAERAQAGAKAEAREQAEAERRFLQRLRERRQQFEDNLRARRQLIRDVLAYLPGTEHGIVLPAPGAARESRWLGFQAGILERSPSGAVHPWLRWAVTEVLLDPRKEGIEADVVLEGVGAELWVHIDGLTEGSADAPRAPPRSGDQGPIAAELIINITSIVRSPGAVHEALIRSALCENVLNRGWRRLPF